MHACLLYCGCTKVDAAGSCSMGTADSIGGRRGRRVHGGLRSNWCCRRLVSRKGREEEIGGNSLTGSYQVCTGTRISYECMRRSTLFGQDGTSFELPGGWKKAA